MSKARTALWSVVFCIGCWLLLALAPQTAAGVRQGLVICGGVIIPSLFPFLVMASIAGSCPLPRTIARLLGFAARRIYLLPPETAPALLMSWLGGYPAGAKVLCELVRRGRISARSASRALTCCVNSGPAFMAAIVGGIFGSARVGLLIFGCQLLAGIFTAWVSALLMRCDDCAAATATDIQPTDTRSPAKSGGAGGVFVGAVSSATCAILVICSFVILFSALLALLDALGVTLAAAAAISRLSGGALSPAAARCLLAGMLEICCGCSLAAELPAGMAALVLPFLLSFASLSVICQNCALFAGTEVSMRPMALSRLLHGFAASLLTLPWLYRRTLVSSVYSAGSVRLGEGFSPAGSALMIILAALLYISIEMCCNSHKIA